MALDLSTVDNTWTLFLDRDGVLNEEKENSYIFNRSELHLYDGAANAVAALTPFFGHVFLATNQKGIGKGLMTVEDLDDIHAVVREQVALAGGKIDKIYFCPDLDDNSRNRKPQPGMALQAKKDFPEIDLSKSIMVGNRMSDMAFGRNAGMKTVFVATTHPATPFPHALIDLRFENLAAFSAQFTDLKKKDNAS